MCSALRRPRALVRARPGARRGRGVAVRSTARRGLAAASGGERDCHHRLACHGDDRVPWSEVLAAWVAEAVPMGIPVLGVCYGHQLLAHALGGEVDYHPAGPEVGTVPVRLTPAARTDPLFARLPETFYAHATHAQSVLRLPAAAVHLAGNDYEPHHAAGSAGGAGGAVPSRVRHRHHAHLRAGARRPLRAGGARLGSHPCRRARHAGGGPRARAVCRNRGQGRVVRGSGGLSFAPGERSSPDPGPQSSTLNSMRWPSRRIPRRMRSPRRKSSIRASSRATLSTSRPSMLTMMSPG